MMEGVHRERYREIISWIDRNLYKMATAATAVGFFLGMREAAETNNIVIFYLSSMFGMMALPGLILWAKELCNTKVF
jgi:hypothetical protein